jgi:hypothetical protein
MCDSVNVSSIPSNATLIGAYVDGLYRNDVAMRRRFPNAHIVEITVFASDDIGIMGDCEKGDMWPYPRAIAWVQLRRAAGKDPTVYVGENNWSGLRQAFQLARITEPHYVVANHDGVPVIPAGAVGKQYQDILNCDYTVVAPYWPGVDPAPQPTPKDDDMAPWMFEDTHGNIYALTGDGTVHIPTTDDVGKLGGAPAVHGPFSDEFVASLRAQSPTP